jgi:hypothetical protein
MRHGRGSCNGNAVAAAGIDVINISYVGILAEDIYHGIFLSVFVTKNDCKRKLLSPRGKLLLSFRKLSLSARTIMLSLVLYGFELGLSS